MRKAAVGLCAIVALHIFHVMADDGLGVLTNKIDAALAMPGKPVLVDNRFCGISFAERVTKRSSSTRKVRDGNGFESNPRVKLKKPFRKFTDAILTYTEHGYLENVSLVYVFPKIRDDKDMATSTKEFSEVALVIGKKYGMTFVDGTYDRCVLAKKNGSREVVACYEFDSPTAVYRIQAVMEAWTCQRARVLMKGTAPLQTNDERYLVMIVSVDNKKSSEQERDERLKELNTNGADAL